MGNFEFFDRSFLSPLVDEEFKFTVEAAKGSLMQPLSVLVLGRSGLIYSKTHEEANDQNKIELSIPITNEMAPQSDLVVFYLRESDGAPVYDSVKITITFICDAYVSTFFFLKF